ncbi:MAG TPA: nucleoside-diphosphate sugar epimerase/dehydratase [Cytophagaceae bacterium]
MNNFINKIPRWTVLQIDILVCTLSLVLAYELRFNFEIPAEYWGYLKLALPLIIFVKIIFFFYTKSYAGIIRFTSVEDAKKIVLSLTGSLITILSIDVIYSLTVDNPTNFIPVSVLLIDYCFSMLFMGAFRVVAKIMYYESRAENNTKINVIIYGAGDAGLITKKTLNQDAGINYNVVAFIDDSPAKSKNTVDGVVIYPPKKLADLVVKKKVELLIIAIQNISPERKKEIIDACLTLGVRVRTIPPVERWINGELSYKQIKEVKIEDVLGREPIKLDNKEVHAQIVDQVVLVTGAAGSIGSELARQIVRYNPKKVMLLDQAESPIYDLELELSEMPIKINFETVVADITNKERMERVFKYLQPDLVFHAAAYKHVPVMEQNPSEAVLTNINGTKILADLSVKYGVKKFVMVSTDKAVNPTNVMGASKRIAEMYTQSLNSYCSDSGGTRFITTRFGNVLGSNGSVIPRFRKQIADGGPVTITHPEITRYFMTIPEACQLVLEAGAMGKGGEIFLFDMGQSIRIVDLAKKMIKLSGLTLGKDIQIMFTGLRPGEKLYEELLNDKENTIPTHHPKIMVAKVRELDYQIVSRQVSELVMLFGDQDNDAIIMKMKQMVPEFKSNNSIYEKFDKVANQVVAS